MEEIKLFAIDSCFQLQEADYHIKLIRTAVQSNRRGCVISRRPERKQGGSPAVTVIMARQRCGHIGSAARQRMRETELSQIKAGDRKLREERRAAACGANPSIRPSDQGKRLNRRKEESFLLLQLQQILH
ncbi:hypothetical protein SRHO_G00001200 [Serrasalmus rhombeus]